MKSTTRSLRFLPALLACLFGVAPALAVTIDSFTTNQAGVSTPPGGASVATGGADILGTRRALETVLFPGGAGPVTSSVSAGALALTVTPTTPDSRGEAVVTWDGDAVAGNLNVTGLAGQNLASGGQTALRFRVNSATAGTEIVVDVHTSATAASRAFLRVPTAIGAATDLYLSYVHDFVPIAASPADFTNVGAIQMRVRGLEVSVSLDIVDTVGPNVTATKRDLLLDNSPISGTVLEGSTFKYRITVGNTGGMSQGTDLSDTVDANTTLNAATIRATPVAIDDSYVTAGNVGRTVAAPGILANDFDPDTAGSAPELVVAAASVGTFATTLGGSITIAADGGFTYEPPVGVFKSVDTFAYTLQDNDAQTDTAQVKIAIGPRVWFVDDAHPGTNVGTLANPFVGFTAGNVNGAGGAGDQDAAGDIIFVRSGNHAATVELEASEWLLGEGDGLTIDGQVIVAAGADPVLTSAGHGIVLASNNTVRGLTIGNTGASNFDIVGSNFGTLTASNIDLTGTGGALSLTNGTLAATFDTVQSTSGTHGINLDTASGTLTVNGTTSLSNLGFGLRVVASGTLNTTFTGTATLSASAGTALLASTGGTLNFSGTSNTATATGGPAVDITGTSLGSGATFSTVSSSSSVGKGLNLDTVSGAFIANGGSITGPANIGVDINAGSSTITYAGSITSTAASRLLEVTARTGGTVTLSGNLSGTGASHTGINIANNTGGAINLSGGTKTLSTSGNAAVTLSSNSGSTVNFTGGGLNITTTSGVGFNATGGATGISVQGSGNVIGSSTGTALNVASTTIAAAGLTFQSISANGAPSGIVLNATGSSGGLTVTGTAGAGSGGTIQASTGAGISLTSTSSVNLNRMVVQTSGDDGILGTSVNGFTLADSSVINNGNSTTDEGLELVDMAGAVNLTNVTATGNAHNNAYLNDSNNTGGNSTLTIAGSSFSSNNATNGNHGMLLEIRGTAVLGTSTISGSTFNNNKSIGLQVITGDSASINDLTIQTNTFQDTGTGNSQEIAMDISKGGTSNLTVKVLNNTNITGHNSHGMNFFTAAGAGTTGTYNARISGNTIGNSAVAGSGSAIGNCIRININGDADATVLVDGNILRQCPNGRGIEAISRNGTGGLDLTVTNNDVNPQDTSGFPLCAIFAQSNTATVANTLRSDIRGNTVPAGMTFDLLPTYLCVVETSTSVSELVDSPPASGSCTAQLTSTNTGSGSASAGCVLIAGPISTPP